MNFSAWAIRNPVPPILVFVMLTVLGLMGFNRLDVLNFPEMDLPTISITASLDGAAAAQLESEVARKIEDARVFALKREHSRLSANDCFALVTTTCQENGILLTGDNLLRKVATARAVRVHGVLWIIDELHAAGVCEVELLISALQVWRADDAVFLPVAEIDKRLRRFSA